MSFPVRVGVYSLYGPFEHGETIIYQGVVVAPIAADNADAANRVRARLVDDVVGPPSARGLAATEIKCFCLSTC